MDVKKYISIFLINSPAIIQMIDSSVQDIVFKKNFIIILQQAFISAMDNKVKVKIKIQGEIIITSIKQSVTLSSVIGFLRQKSLISNHVDDGQLIIKNFNGTLLNIGQVIQTIPSCNQEQSRELSIDWKESQSCRQPIPTSENVQYEAVSEEIFKTACQYLISHDIQQLRILYNKKKISKDLFIVMHKMSQTNSQKVNDNVLHEQLKMKGDQSRKRLEQLESHIKDELQQQKNITYELKRKIQSLKKQLAGKEQQIEAINHSLQEVIRGSKDPLKILEEKKNNMPQSYENLKQFFQNFENKTFKIKELQNSFLQSKSVKSELLMSVKSGSNLPKLHKSKTFQLSQFTEALQESSTDIKSFIEDYTGKVIKDIRSEYYYGLNGDNDFIKAIACKPNFIMLFSTKDSNKLFGIFSPQAFPKPDTKVIKPTDGFLFTLINTNRYFLREKKCLWTSSTMDLKLGDNALIMSRDQMGKMKKKKDINTCFDLRKSTDDDILGTQSSEIELSSFELLTVHFDASSSQSPKYETPGREKEKKVQSMKKIEESV